MPPTTDTYNSANAFAHFKAWLRSAQHFEEQDCEVFLPHLRERQLSKYDHLVHQGEVCEEIGFVVEGDLRMYYGMDGKEINTHFFFPDEFAVVYESFLQARPSRYNIQALTDARLVTFGLHALQLAYDRSPRWERFGRKMAEGAYAAATARIEGFLFMDAMERYNALASTRPEVLERIPLYQVASYLGIERETLSRIRHKLVKGK